MQRLHGTTDRLALLLGAELIVFDDVGDLLYALGADQKRAGAVRDEVGPEQELGGSVGEQDAGAGGEASDGDAGVDEAARDVDDVEGDAAARDRGIGCNNLDGEVSPLSW